MSTLTAARLNQRPRNLIDPDAAALEVLETRHPAATNARELLASRLIHALRAVYRPSDPDARAEAEAFCGYGEECGGSGRHGLVAVSKATCPACIRLAAVHRAEEREQDRAYLAAERAHFE